MYTRKPLPGPRDELTCGTDDEVGVLGWVYGDAVAEPGGDDRLRVAKGRVAAQLSLPTHLHVGRVRRRLKGTLHG